MTQNELNVMIVIVIESKILETIVGYENIIKDFMSYIYIYILLISHMALKIPETPLDDSFLFL